MTTTTCHGSDEETPAGDFTAPVVPMTRSGAHRRERPVAAAAGAVGSAASSEVPAPGNGRGCA